MNKILLTGSTGFIGQSLVSSLLKDKKKIFALIRKNTKNTKSASKIRKKHKNFSPIFFKKNDELISKISYINPQVVINLATNYIPFPSHKEISSVLNSNIIFPTLILDLCCKSKVKKIINMCSIMQCNKNKIDNPQNFYALTKILFKKSMAYYQEIYPKKIILNLYIGDSYGSNDGRKKILPTLIKNYKKNKTTTILTKNLKLNILHVNDIVNGIKILTKSIKKSGDYFIKSRNQFDLFKVIKIFNSKTARKVKLVWLNKKTTTINNIRIKTIPGWKQKINVINYFYNDLNESN